MRTATGFTLIEVITVVAILAILATVAAPEMRLFMASQIVKTPASDLYSSLVLARSEAIKRNAAIDLVPTVTTDWAQGWQVRVQSGGTVLRTQDSYPRVAITPSASGTVTYGGNGRLSTSATTFRILVPGSPDARMRCVTVDVTGRPNVRVDRNTDQTACD
ncbi:MAG TPA: GspH/FimT family pseudopilin [Vicinamibacterales bacterium]|nr:GspH/FimT family pseudopilin [Vicinamibacterales bacterium]